ncbi:MAG: radical SAM protein [Bacteroidetes bacterium]|nr:radical SAM protein [Bacteroidota bacterium]
MNRLVFLSGKDKKKFNLAVRLSIFRYYLGFFFRGKLSPGKLVRLLRRLNYFLSAIQHNKFVNINGKTKIDLYVPGYPSDAFYTASRKFMEFDKTMPCTTVLISITSACRYHCPHCYQKYDKGADIDINVLKNTIKRLQDMGVAFFNIEGGDPFLVFDRLKEVCRTIDPRSEIFINATGDGMTPGKLRELKQDNIVGIMFPAHSHDKEEFNRFMGKAGAWDTMEAGIEMCRAAGIAPAFNTCLDKKAFYNGRFEKLMDLAREKNIALVQIIKVKPAGGNLKGETDSLTPEEIQHIKTKVHRYNLDPDFADYPSISAQIIEEDKSLFGCTAGGTDRFYINAKGDLQPCEFINISFGNIVHDDFDEIYTAMREHFRGGGDCWICEKHATKVNELFAQSGKVTLPLSKEDSKKIYCNWKRGETSDFYRNVYRL